MWVRQALFVSLSCLFTCTLLLASVAAAEVRAASGIVVRPGPKDEVIVINPTTLPLKLIGAGMDERIDPAGRIALPSSTTSRTFTLAATTGAPMVRFVVEPAGAEARSERFLMITPTFFDAISDIKTNGASTKVIKTAGVGRTQTVQVDGSFPAGTRFYLSNGTKKAPAFAFVQVRDSDGNIKSVFMQFDKVEGFENAKVSAADPLGNEIGSREVQIVAPVIDSVIAPKNGKANSEATMTIDCSDVLSVLSAEGLGTAKDYVLLLDYSQSGGATGPDRTLIGDDGKAIVKVKRGKKKGDFEVGVTLVPKS